MKNEDDGKDVVMTNEEHNQDIKKRLSKENGGLEVVNYEQLIQVAPQFAEWLKQINWGDKIDSNMLIFLDRNIDKTRFVVKFFTNTYCYSISGYEGKMGYLGCIATTRKNRVGELWGRGNDLPDGNYSKQTFNNIVKGVVKYEMKQLELWRK